MLLLIGLIAGLAVGALRGGKLLRLGELRGLWFAIASLVLDPVLHAVPDIGLWPKGLLTSACYLCVVLFAVVNRRAKVGAALLGTGTVLNYAVRAANAFRMPVSAKALEVYAGISAQEVLAQQGIALDCGETLRLAPHTHGTDGFFAAVLERHHIEGKP